MDCPKSTISLHSGFYKIQRIPFNRLLTAFLKALFQQALVEQIQRIPFNRLLTAFLRALFQQASVEQIQRIPLNRLLMAIFGVLSWRCIVDACFLDFGGLPEIGNSLLQVPLQLTAFWLRAGGGTSGGLFSRFSWITQIRQFPFTASSTKYSVCRSIGF